MSNEIQIFENEEFGQIRIILINGEPWFIGVEVARKLGYDNPRSTIHNYVDKDYTCVSKINTQGQMRNVTLINEPGLYQLIFHSKLDSAKTFQKWVFEELLPSIRKHGLYVTEQKKYELLHNPDAIIEICNQWKQEIEKNKQLTKELEIAKPKAEYCDKILQTPDLVPITAIAKDYGMSAVKFNRLLKELGIQYKRGDMWYLYQEYSDKGWTQTKTYSYEDEDGNGRSAVHTYWTQKGRLGLYQLLKEFNYLPLIEQEDK